MSRDIVRDRPQTHEHAAEKGALLIIAFVCVSFCVMAGAVVWIAG
jgi:hypothetical protein